MNNTEKNHDGLLMIEDYDIPVASKTHKTEREDAEKVGTWIWQNHHGIYALHYEKMTGVRSSQHGNDPETHEAIGLYLKEKHTSVFNRTLNILQDQLDAE